MGRELPPSRATARAQDAAVQVGSIRPALPQHARHRPQYVQPSTPSHLPVDAADLQSRSGSAMVRRRCSDVRPDQPLPPFNPPLVAVTNPALLLAHGALERRIFEPSAEHTEKEEVLAAQGLE